MFIMYIIAYLSTLNKYNHWTISHKTTVFYEQMQNRMLWSYMNETNDIPLFANFIVSYVIKCRFIQLLKVKIQFDRWLYLMTIKIFKYLIQVMQFAIWQLLFDFLNERLHKKFQIVSMGSPHYIIITFRLLKNISRPIKCLCCFDTQSFVIISQFRSFFLIFFEPLNWK